MNILPTPFFFFLSPSSMWHYFYLPNKNAGFGVWLANPQSLASKSALSLRCRCLIIKVFTRQHPSSTSKSLFFSLSLSLILSIWSRKSFLIPSLLLLGRKPHFPRTNTHLLCRGHFIDMMSFNPHHSLSRVLFLSYRLRNRLGAVKLVFVKVGEGKRTEDLESDRLKFNL